MIRQPGYSRQIAPDPKIKIGQILDTGKISKIKKNKSWQAGSPP
nr:hypothetical protein [uncultured Desulfobacter sp.]